MGYSRDMRTLAVFAAVLVVICCIFRVSDAQACAVAYESGSFVRLAGEQTVIVWDAEKKIEHFIRKPAFLGDPRTFGFVVPTPAVPVIAKASEEVFAALARLIPQETATALSGVPMAAAAAPVEVEQRVQIDDFEVVTLRATDADALGEWLRKNGFMDRPTLRKWSERYLARGWLLNAMRYAPISGADKRPGRVETPTVRLSFTIDEPFYPYTEAPPEPADEASFLARNASARQDARPLALWVVSAQQMRAFEGNKPVADTREHPMSGPRVTGRAPIASNVLATALGDTKAWGFEPRSRAIWQLTQLNEEATVRTAFDDLVFRPVSAAIGTPAGDPAQDHRTRNKRTLGLLLLLAVALGLAVAFSTDRSPRG